MIISLGVSVAISRFLGTETSRKRLEKIKSTSQLNAVEFGLLNCVIGRATFPGTTPFPTENQAKDILDILSPMDYHHSAHAPYRISATSNDPKKLKFSKSNLSATLKTADYLQAKHVTFHAGSFKQAKYDSSHVQSVLKEWEEWRQTKGFKAKLAPEVGGKTNSFADFFTLAKIAGGIDNMLITWDISHDFARGGNITSEDGILKRLETLDNYFDLHEQNRLPVHFSGMIVGRTGEKHHTLLDHDTGVPWKLVFSVIKEQRYLNKLNLICESKIPKGQEKTLKGNAITDAIRVHDFLNSDEVIKTYKGKPSMLDYYFKD